MKKINLIITLLILSVFLSGCTAFKAITLLNSSERVTGKTPDSHIPFILQGHMILIQARINHSSKEYTFILDTGALTMMSKKVAEELFLPQGINVDASGSGGNTQEINLVKLDSVIVGGMEVKDCASGITDFSTLFPRDIAGIIGSNFLQHFKVTIDYQRHGLTLSNDTSPVDVHDDEIRVPIELNMFHGFAPVVEVAIDDIIQEEAIIDTGMDEYIALPASVIKRSPSFKNGSVVASKGSMRFGMFGSVKNENYALRLNKVKIGHLQLTNVPATSHGHKEGKILIGYRFLEKYLVVLNYPAGEMILLPTGTPFEHNIPSWGLALTIKDHKTVVSGVWQGSEAVKQGLQPGDEIVAINSVKMSNIHTVGELILMFFADKEQRSITVEFVHESERKTVVLHKKDLLPAL